MHPGEVESTPSTARWRWRALACLLILGGAGLRLAYLACDCRLDLAPDEAHYWDWSRHPDWSYYSKGPVVAYLIRAGCELAGPLSCRLTGCEALAVRLPAVLCGSLLLLSLYVLTVQIWRRELLALLVVACALTMPVIAAGSTLMTIDSPYCCCWGWALVVGYQAVFRGGRWAWPMLGLVIGLGILAKYTMILFIPSLGLFLLATPQQRRLLRTPGPWLAAAVAAVCSLPILVWNAEHDWVSFRHIFGLTGIPEPDRSLLWLGPVRFVAVQFLLLLGFWFLVWARAMLTHAPWREPRSEVRYLWWLSAPMFMVFLLFGLKTGGGEPNWPVTTYLSGLVLAVPWLHADLQAARGWYRRCLLGGLTFACVAGLTLTVLLHNSTWLWPLLAEVAGPATEDRPLPLRRLDPTCRLRGWRLALAAEVDRVRDELRGAGIEPVVAASGWALPGELGFYCRGHPTVYSLGPLFGERRSQYDFWRPSPIWDPSRFIGRTFVFVSPGPPGLDLPVFDRVGRPRIVTYSEDGHPVARWHLTICHGFRGFPAMPWVTNPSY
jgi:hypothetical protein